MSSRWSCFLVAACSSINVVGAACRPPSRLVCKYAEQRSRTNRSTPKKVTAFLLTISRNWFRGDPFSHRFRIKLSWPHIQVKRAGGQGNKKDLKSGTSVWKYCVCIKKLSILECMIISWSLIFNKYMPGFSFFFNHVRTADRVGARVCVSFTTSTKLIKVAANNWM